MVPPESIVTASTSWLGDDFDSALLNGALVEAIRFMKGEADMSRSLSKNVCRGDYSTGCPWG